MAVSEKKLQANRENALNSTGPRSKDGKAKVAPQLRQARPPLGPDRPAGRGCRRLRPDGRHLDGRLEAADRRPPRPGRAGRGPRLAAPTLPEARARPPGRARPRGPPRAPRPDPRRGGRGRRPLKARPGWALARLVRETEGLQFLAGAWSELAGSATAEGWRSLDDHHMRLMNLMGLGDDDEAEEADGTSASWWLMAGNCPLRPTPPSTRSPRRRRGRALAAEVAALIAEQRRGGPSATGGAPVRGGVGAATGGDVGGAGRLGRGPRLLRYEGQHGREFRATLNQLIRLTQTDLDLVPGDEPEPESPPQVVTEPSIEPDPCPAPSKATAAVAEVEPAAPSEATEAAGTPPEAPRRRAKPPRPSRSGRIATARPSASTWRGSGRPG